MLYNFGACINKAACNKSKDVEDDQKSAAKLFEMAASVFAYLRDNTLHDTHKGCTMDLSREALSVNVATMLAQSQEIVYTRNLLLNKDKKKQEATALRLSQITAHCSELYASAVKAIEDVRLKPMQDVSHYNLTRQKSQFIISNLLS